MSEHQGQLNSASWFWERRTQGVTERYAGRERGVGVYRVHGRLRAGPGRRRTDDLPQLRYFTTSHMRTLTAETLLVDVTCVVRSCAIRSVEAPPSFKPRNCCHNPVGGALLRSSELPSFACLQGRRTTLRAQTFSMPGTSRRHGPPASLTCAPTPTLSIAPLDSGFRALERYRELTRRPLIRCATRCCAVARNVFSAKGEATSPESGVGFLNGHNPTNYSMSAYKFHLSDPIVRSEPSRPSGSLSFARCCFCHHCTSRLFLPGVVGFLRAHSQQL